MVTVHGAYCQCTDSESVRANDELATRLTLPVGLGEEGSYLYAEAVPSSLESLLKANRTLALASPAAQFIKSTPWRPGFFRKWQ